MPQGIIIRDEAGSVMLDTTTATGLIFGAVSIVGTQTKTVTNPEFAVSRPFFIIVSAAEAFRRNKPTVTFSGEVMTFKGNGLNDATGTYTVYYGVY